MSIDKNILFKQIKDTLAKHKAKLQCDFDWILGLIKLVLFHNPVENVVFKSQKIQWKNFPKDKSLFYSNANVGLPIGNLTSQLFGNIYLDCLDKYIKYQLEFKYYGRYVDDFFLIDGDKPKLKNVVKTVRKFLIKNLNLILHPNKIYLQHFKNGVAFLGAFIKPYRICPNKRIKGNFYKTQNYQQNFYKFFTKVNSYLGLMSKFDSYKLRKKILFSKNNFGDNYAVNYKITKIILTNKGKQYV
jgi:RNA-directed DNA polymerase